jgi:hypothetical protein
VAAGVAVVDTALGEMNSGKKTGSERGVDSGQPGSEDTEQTR